MTARGEAWMAMLLAASVCERRTQPASRFAPLRQRLRRPDAREEDGGLADLSKQAGEIKCLLLRKALSHGDGKM